MPWRAVTTVDVGTGTPVHAGEIIPAKVAEGIGLPDDPAYRSPFISEGRIVWTDSAAPRTTRKSAAKKATTRKATAKQSAAKKSTARDE